MSPPAVSCHGLIKRYDKVVAVDGLDLEVAAGECFGMLGPNGAGKTTTVEMIQGLIPPDGGTVQLFGLPWEGNEADLRQRLGTALQETKLPEKLSVIETLRLFRSFYRKSVSEETVLELVQLQEKRDSWVNKLSGGQRQRLAVACALVCDPDILFLDEPTTGLDPQSRRQLWDVINQFRSRGGTVVLTTHYMEEAEQLCDRVGVVDHGKMIALGSPKQLIAGLGAEHVVDFAVAGEAVLGDAELSALPGVTRVHHEDGHTRLTVQRVHQTLPALMALVGGRNIQLAELTTHHATLEDVFMSLTGRHLRDG
ncbi:MAG: ABC transporter ATP-binding protein [Gemmatimonadetes bacterium]|nr:ABC transporter ATP-binding protein [Gemmatimonadota bacterium]